MYFLEHTKIKSKLITMIDKSSTLKLMLLVFLFGLCPPYYLIHNLWRSSQKSHFPADITWYTYLSQWARCLWFPLLQTLFYCVLTGLDPSAILLLGLKFSSEKASLITFVYTLVHKYLVTLYYLSLFYLTGINTLFVCFLVYCRSPAIW